jgi:hypothetical protein
MIIHKFEQGTPEWDNIRTGKITASIFHTLMGNSQTKEVLLNTIAAERITGVKSDSSKFSSVHTARGHEMERYARMLYELEYNVKVDEVGFCEMDNKTGFSPDGLVGEDGGVEIKSMDNHTFIKAVNQDSINIEHYTQIQFALYVSGRRWWDYVLFNPNFSNPLHVRRVSQDEETFSKIAKTLISSEEKLDKIINNFKSRF